MGINCHLSVYIKLIMTSFSPVMSLDSLVAPAEEIVIFEKFGDMKLPEDEETEDVDYSPSEAESDDSLEWASETERTMAEDALARGKLASTSMALPWPSLQSMWPATGLFRWDWD